MLLLDTKIYLITFEEDGRLLVSHGVGNLSLKNYILPVMPVSDFKPLQDQEGFYLPTVAGDKIGLMRFMLLSEAGQWEKVELDGADDIHSWMWRNTDKEAVIIDDPTQTYYCSSLALEKAYRQKGKQAKSFRELEQYLVGMIPKEFT